ncbi:hypothetical protein O181_012896 [Austropuccinia psidii MF-1]|uniref:Integrase catalytic domain-containing protein n=1 Tax=Austropuccinia psidii MF-1 TaxID=1389203 RepID=A0A9Q3BYN5_9BASI|nr:hypothetical protein [Austropuccinia psidii MF-1]
MWQKYVSSYCKTCYRCKKAKEIHWQKTWKNDQSTRTLDWVAFKKPGGDRSYNSFIGIFDRFSKTPIFFQCHKDDTAMDTALLIWNRVVSWTGIFTNIISDRDPKLISTPWTNLHQFFQTKVLFPTAYYPKTDGLAEIMIQTLKDMVRQVCAYGLELKYCDGFMHYWCTLLPELE